MLPRIPADERMLHMMKNTRTIPQVTILFFVVFFIPSAPLYLFVYLLAHNACGLNDKHNDEHEEHYCVGELRRNICL